MKLSRSSYKLVRSTQEDFDPGHLEGLYSSASLWHGTGRYQWRYGNNDDINLGSVEEGEQVDVLDRLIQEGLKPHEDRFATQFGTEVTQTTSLTHARMYAALYAKLFQTDGESLIYEFGSNARWGSLYSFGTFIALLRDTKVWSDWTSEHWQHIREHGLAASIQRFMDLQSRATKDQVTWTRNVRKKPLPAWKALFSGGVSDIEGNHPILLGIPEEVISATPTRYSYLGAYETRASNLIPLKACTHMEVPLKHISETRDKLQGAGIEIPVIPMEDGELLMSDKPYTKMLEMQHV